MPDFDAISNSVAENVERPPLAPIGEYVFQVLAVPNINDVSSDKGDWKAVEFQCQAVRPTDSVDPDMFKAYGEAKNIRVRKTFMYDKKDDAAAAQTAFSEKTFYVDHLGLPASMTLKELRNAAVNKQFIGTLRYRADRNDPNVQYHDLGKTAPLA